MAKENDVETNFIADEYELSFKGLSDQTHLDVVILVDLVESKGNNMTMIDGA